MHVPDDHSVLHFNRPLVVEGIVKGICLAFNVPYIIPPVVEPPVTVPEPSTTPPAPEPTPIPSEPCPEKETLQKLHDIRWGKGWWWAKWAKITELLPK